MKQKAGFTFWNYLKLSDKELKELTEDSLNPKIQDIRSRDYTLTKNQRRALCIHIDSNGKFDDYRYFTEGNSPYGKTSED
jgi:hypothetical protein